MLELLQNLYFTQEFELFVKLVLILILAGIIGLERASLSKPAGFGTHVLVGVSAVLVMECGTYLYNIYGNIDPTRIAAQLLSGIGFLGAGTILRDGFSVKGLTTAASLLAVTCIGLIVGAGFYFGGIIATVIVYLVLTYSKFISDKVAHLNELNLQIEAIKPKETLDKIQDLLDKNEIEISEIKIDQEAEKEYIKICGVYRNNTNKNKIIVDLLAFDNVKHISEI